MLTASSVNWLLKIMIYVTSFAIVLVITVSASSRMSEGSREADMRIFSDALLQNPLLVEGNLVKESVFQHSAVFSTRFKETTKLRDETKYIISQLTLRKGNQPVGSIVTDEKFVDWKKLYLGNFREGEGGYERLIVTYPVMITPGNLPGYLEVESYVPTG